MADQQPRDQVQPTTEGQRAMTTPDFTGATWRKSYGSESGDCVEVTLHNGLVGVRDTKDQGNGPILAFTATEWQAFLLGVDAGQFNLDAMS